VSEMRITGDLTARTALVTGASRGIGATVARALADAGTHVVVSARNQAVLESLATTIAAEGGRATAIPCDVANEQSVAALGRAVKERAMVIDILVNNAGVATSAPLHHQTLEDWNRMMAVNATGTFLCTRQFAPAMAERGWGRVINIASLAARTGARYISAYAASKHAVLGFTRSIAAEMADRGVTVNAICPGYVDTNMTEATIERIVRKTGTSREQAVAAILQTTPQQRLIEPAEIAYLVVMLCGDGARGVNGQAVGVDGGEFLG